MIGVEVAAGNGQTFAIVVEGDEVTIGRSSSNDVVLRQRLISKRHARVVLRDGKLIIVDLKSTNGTFVNGKRITSPQVFWQRDRVALGDFTLSFGATRGTYPPGAAPPWAGDHDEHEQTSIRGAPRPPSAPAKRAVQQSSPVPVGIHDEVTPPVGVPQRLASSSSSATDEPGLVLREVASGLAHVVSKFGATIGRAFVPLDGRTTAPSIGLDSAAVSARHARVTLEGDWFLLRDLGSATGTVMGGQRITSAPLTVGARFSIADLTLEVEHIGTAESAARVANTPPRAPGASRSAAPRPARSSTIIDDHVALGVTTVAPTSAQQLRAGDIGLLERLRDDGMLITWRGRAGGQDARVVQLSEPVRDDHDMVATFEDLAQLARRFASPRLPRFLAHERGLLATSPPPAATLHQVLANTGPLPAELAVFLALEAALALADFHDVRDHDGTPLHAVLRSLSTSNIELSDQGELRLTGFTVPKLAAHWRRSKTGAGVIKGEIPFMSPEQVQGGPLDVRSDLWALGVLLYTLAAGEPPFGSDRSMATLRLVLTAPVPQLDRRRSVGAGVLQPVLDALLQREPARRPVTARDVVSQLERTGLELQPATRSDVMKLVRAARGGGQPGA